MTPVPGLEDLTLFRIDVAEGVATVIIDRPPVNAQNGIFREEVMRVFDVLHEAPDVRAIVLTGAGRTFSAGADLKDRPDASKPGAFPRHSRAVRGGFVRQADDSGLRAVPADRIRRLFAAKDRARKRDDLRRGAVALCEAQQ